MDPDIAVMHGLVKKCRAHDLEDSAWSPTGSTGLFVGQKLWSPSLGLVKTRKYMNNVGCGSDLGEIMLKVA